jgi:hypothetical protein
MIRAASRPVDGKGCMYRPRGERKEKGVQRRQSFPPSLVYSSCTRSVRLASSRIDSSRSQISPSHPYPIAELFGRARSSRCALSSHVSSLHPTVQRAQWLATFGVGVREGSRSLGVPSVEIEIRGSTRMVRARPSARRKRREHEYEIDANARRNEGCIAYYQYLSNVSAINCIRSKEQGKDAMCGGAREGDDEATAEG